MNFTIKTIGCKVNTYESNKLKSDLIKSDFNYVEINDNDSFNGIDLYIINTCSVTSVADKKSRQMIHKAKKNNNKLKIIAMGCYVDSHINDIDNCIDLIIKNKDKKDAKKIILKYLNIEDKKNENIKIENCKIREFIKIQDGCNQYCSYCIIPYLRGDIKSRNDEDIVAEIENKIKNGTKEIVLTGIHLSSFGIDRVNKNYEGKEAIDYARESIINIINKIAKIKINKDNSYYEVERIRLGSLEPRIINENFLKALNNDYVKNKFCSNFCLSLQSGSNKTLKAMNRHYTTNDFENACEIIRKYLPNATITTDIIVGFPNETNEDFLESLEFVKQMRFYNPNIFPYSKREGTVAAKSAGQIPNAEKHRRVKIMIEECDKITKEIEKKYSPCFDDILVEEIKIENNKKYAIGYTKEYIKCKFNI